VPDANDDHRSVDYNHHHHHRLIRSTLELLSVPSSNFIMA